MTQLEPKVKNTTTIPPTGGLAFPYDLGISSFRDLSTSFFWRLYQETEPSGGPGPNQGSGVTRVPSQNGNLGGWKT